MSKEIINPSGYDMPKPTRFIILDNISTEEKSLKEELEKLRQLVDAPCSALLTDIPRLSQRLKVKLERKKFKPDFLISIGNAGKMVANNLGLDLPQFQLNPTRKAGHN